MRRGKTRTLDAMTLAELKAEFRDKALDPDDMFLLAGQDAIDFIDRSIANGFRLLGVEGFRITPFGAIQPDQDQSNDIADVDLTDAEFVEETKHMIRGGSKVGYRYEIVVKNGV
jgi:hypothetical protein